MKKIIEEVLQAEEKVGTTLKEARTEAMRLKSEAEKEVAEKLNAAKDQSREIVQTAIEQAKRDAEGLRQKRLNEVDAAHSSLLHTQTESMDQLVDSICQVVLTTGGKDA